ncbi:hypothetical protein ACIPID_13705 [Cupriavidus sp. CER94]|uniref:hypothetical protein n=1 Tax=Cupriavidus sp. CER94 TaxID=3377036 RepID=UPI00382E98CF
MSNFKFSSFLRFGADLREASRARQQDAAQHIEATRGRIGQTGKAAAEALRQVDATRAAVFERSIVPIQALHRGNIVMAGAAPTAGQAERFLAAVPVAPEIPSLRSASAGAAASVLGAAGVAAAAIALVPSVSLLVPAAVAGVGSLICAMCVAYRVAHANAQVIDGFAVQVRDFGMAADRFVAEAHAIQAGADDACRALEALASEADASVTQLEPVVMDAANAAVLLRSVLETALLDGDGALVPNIMAQLAGHRQAIETFEQQTAATPALSAA